MAFVVVAKINIFIGLILIGYLCSCLNVNSQSVQLQKSSLTLSHPSTTKQSSAAGSNRQERRTLAETSLSHLSAPVIVADNYAQHSPVASAMLSSDAVNSINYMPSAQLSSIGHYTRIMPANNPIDLQQPSSSSSSSYLVRNANNIHLVEQQSYQSPQKSRKPINQLNHFEHTAQDSSPIFVPSSTRDPFVNAPPEALLRATGVNSANAYMDGSTLLNVPVIDANVNETHTNDFMGESSSKSHVESSAPPVTTDQSNNVLAQSVPEEPLVRTISHLDDSSSNNQVLQAPTQVSNSNASNSAANDLNNNQVIYEASQVSSGMDNYYFSSSEKLPKSDSRSSNVWW